MPSAKRRDASQVLDRAKRIKEILGGGQNLGEDFYGEVMQLVDDIIGTATAMDARSGKRDASYAKEGKKPPRRQKKR